MSIGQIWARELDEGRYLCSASSMYRIARAAGQTRERRRQATHPATVKPELLADGPSQVWTWDITKLPGPAKGIWFQLYVLIDIYSRFNPSWIISPVEDSLLATDFIAEAIERNGIHPHTVHSDSKYVKCQVFPGFVTLTPINPWVYRGVGGVLAAS